MKKLMVLAMAMVLGLALTASAQVKVQESTKTVGDTTIEKTKVENKETGAKFESKTTETATSTTTDTKVKGENIKAEKKTVDTAAGETGKVKVDVKKGEIKDLQVTWAYYTENKNGTVNYILDYTVNDKMNKKLKTEANLTDEEMALIKKGSYTVVSTSPYTANDIQNEFRTIVIKDLQTALRKK